MMRRSTHRSQHQVGWVKKSIWSRQASKVLRSWSKLWVVWSTPLPPFLWPYIRASSNLRPFASRKATSRSGWTWSRASKIVTSFWPVTSSSTIRRRRATSAKRAKSLLNWQGSTREQWTIAKWLLAQAPMKFISNSKVLRKRGSGSRQLTRARGSCTTLTCPNSIRRRCFKSLTKLRWLIKNVALINSSNSKIMKSNKK